MPARLIDPKAEKTIDVSGSTIVIIPLRRNQKRKVYQAMPDISEIDLPRKEDESDEDYGSRRFAAAAVRADQDAIADIIGDSITKVDKVSLSGSEWLKNLRDENDFWKCFFAIMAWTGIDEDTANFSDSSSAQSTADPAGEDAEPPVKKEDEPASTTPTTE